jgi:5'-nucleotidase
VIATQDPSGGDVFWFAPTPRGEPEPGTDRHAVEAGLVSITPLRLDLTDETAVGRA